MQRLDQQLGESETPSNVVSRAVAVIEARLAQAALDMGQGSVVKSASVEPPATSIATSPQSLFGSGNKAAAAEHSTTAIAHSKAPVKSHHRLYDYSVPYDIQMPRSGSPEYYLEPGQVYDYSVPIDIQCTVRNRNFDL